MCCPPLFGSQKYHKIENCFFFNWGRKKNWANLQRITELIIKKIVNTALKNIGLESGIWKKPIPDVGSRIQGSKRHRIPDPQHWEKATRTK